LPDLIVTARELRYDKKPYKRGERFTASEKDAKVLKMLRKVEDAPENAPVRKVAETQAPPAKVEAESVVEVVPDPASEPEAKPGPTARAMMTDDMPEAPQGRYRNRALKSDD
jgi:hypothetical protein